MDNRKLYSDFEELKEELLSSNGKNTGKLLRTVLKMKKQLIKANKSREEKIE